MELKNIISNALKKKSPDELIAVSKKSELKKTLNVFDLIILGIGAVVGTGIFTIIGTAIQGGPESAGAGQDRKSTRLNSSHKHRSRMPSSA